MRKEDLIVTMTKGELHKLIYDSVLLALSAHQKNVVEKDTEEDLMTIEGACKFLDLTRPTVYSKVSKGELPFMKRSKRLYFSKKELRKYLEGRDGKSMDAYLKRQIESIDPLVLVDFTELQKASRK